DGQEFDGGKGADMTVELGQGRFIPGFEEQLIGANAAEDRTVAVKFPDDYGVKTLAGKDASFAVKVKEVRRAPEVPLDDELAKKVGVESLEALKTAIKEQIGSERARFYRTKLKRE